MWWAVVIVLILLLIWSRREKMTQLNCRSDAAKSAAQDYYNDRSEYRGIARMTPVSSVQVDDYNCDVKYSNVRLSARKIPAVDSRRFTYKDGNVVLMGRPQSGALNP